ncbi:MAG: hypothetical protein HC900_00110 [Methylacidiphilales bacterium]|nr:hypothetical protein [Candidatus Methylacidiphilales bacterium]
MMLALSVRQPWARAIIHGRKDVENRDWCSGGANEQMARRLADRRERIAIHASTGMTRSEYHEFADFWFGELLREEPLPALSAMERGGIIGTARLIAVVCQHPSRWFFGRLGMVLAEPEPCQIFACRGTLTPMFWPVPQGFTAGRDPA